MAVPSFPRSSNDRVLTGVAGGLAERLGIDLVFVRAGFVALAGAGGAGLAAYLFAALLSTAAAPAPTRVRRPAPPGQQAIAFPLLMLGVLVVLREVGLWFGDAVTWPLAAAATGSAVIWASNGEAERRPPRWLARHLAHDPLTTLVEGPMSLARIGAGGLLVLSGMAGFLAANRALTFSAVGPVLLAVAVTVAGVALVTAPWLWRLVRQLQQERHQRIRSEERAEVAAHLHDSVLQTLALIQRADVPGEVVGLARRQERELRAWLYGVQRDPARLGAAIEEAAARVEELHGVPIDVVLVGDAPLDEHLRALVLAASEAMSNAARHAGADLVSVYVEVEADRVSAFVTDRGKGFDPAAVPPDRLGIARSIVGRLQRHGGRVTVLSEPGEGTEVELSLPRGGA